MSWAVEEWKDGLPGKALQKIQEMEAQLDKLKKERTQKQFQVDSLEAALQKQKQKVSLKEERVNGLKNYKTVLIHLVKISENSIRNTTHKIRKVEFLPLPVCFNLFPGGQ